MGRYNVIMQPENTASAKIDNTNKTITLAYTRNTKSLVISFKQKANGEIKASQAKLSDSESDDVPITGYGYR